MLVCNLAAQGGPGKLKSYWEDTLYKVVKQNNDSIPAYVVTPENGKGRTRTLHRNHLMPCDYLPVTPDSQPQENTQRKKRPQRERDNFDGPLPQRMMLPAREKRATTGPHKTVSPEQMKFLRHGKSNAMFLYVGMQLLRKILRALECTLKGSLSASTSSQDAAEGTSIIKEMFFNHEKLTLIQDTPFEHLNNFVTNLLSH